MNIFQRFNNWLDIPSSDPNDARRRKLLSLILIGVIILGGALLLLTVWLWFTTPREQWLADVSNVFWTSHGI